MNDNVTLGEVANPDFVGVSETDSLLGTVRLLAADGGRSAVVMRGREPVGTVCAADVFALLARGGSVAETRVESVMSEPPPTLAPTQSLADAAAALAGAPGGTLLVAAGATAEPLGTVTARELVAAGVASAPANAPAVATGAEPSAYSEQSICEVCGALAPELASYNGQLICADCRGV